MLRAAVIVAAAIAVLALPSAAAAHELTCSTSRWSHWPDIRALPAVKVDDVRGAVCRDRGVDRIELVGFKYGLWWHQRIRRLGETDLPGPFYWNVRYDVGRPYPSRFA